MNPILSLLVIPVVIAGVWLLRNTRAAKAIVYFANAQIVNIDRWGETTKLAGPSVTLSQRYLIVSRDPADGDQYVTPYVAGTIPFAVCPDMTPSTDTAPSNYPLRMNELGMNQQTERMIASAAIATDVLVYPIAGGTVAAVATAAAGTYWVIGKTKLGNSGGASGDQINVIPCFPYQVTIA